MNTPHLDAEHVPPLFQPKRQRHTRVHCAGLNLDAIPTGKPFMGIQKSFVLAPLLWLSAAVLAAPPQAVDDVRTTRVNTPVTINVLSNDSDPDGDAIELVQVSAPAMGTAIVNADGGVLYTPDANFEGTDSFTYLIRDNSEAAETATGTVVIRVSADTFSPVSAAGNDFSVAQALDSACAAVTATPLSQMSEGMAQLNERCLYLQNLSVSNPAAAAQLINQLAPEETLALLRTAASGVDSQVSAVGNRLGQLGRGVSAISINGLHWSPTARGGAESPQSRTGVFANIQLDRADKQATSQENGFKSDAYSVTLGADYAVSPEVFVGGALGWTGNELNYSGDNGSVSANIYSVIAYSSFSRDNFSLDGQLGYGGSSYDIQRNIAFPALKGNGSAGSLRTEGSTTGSQWFVSTRAQYLYHYNALIVYPSVRLSYLTSTLEEYAELNAGGFEVVLGEQSHDQLTAQLGVQAQYALTTPWGVILPVLEFSAISEVISDKLAVMGKFAFAPEDTQSFKLTPEGRESLYFQAGLGASMVVSQGINAYFSYRQLVGYSNFDAFQIQAGLRCQL